MLNITSTYNESLILSEPKEGFKFNFLKKSNSNAPSIFIVGAQKSGTSSLLGNLITHPSILTPKRKEIYFYNNINYYKKGLKWYLNQFPESRLNKKINIDATANYFESKLAPERIKNDFPNAKIIILLRNPTERAYSHYKMAVKLGFEKLSFKDAIDMEQDRLTYSANNYIPKFHHDYVFQRLGYKSKGIYVQFLKNWLTHFSRNEIMIIQSEKYFSNTKSTYQDILNFLQLQTHTPNEFKIFQKGGSESIPLAIKKELDNFYQPYNQQLFDLIGEQFDWNK